MATVESISIRRVITEIEDIKYDVDVTFDTDPGFVFRARSSAEAVRLVYSFTQEHDGLKRFTTIQEAS